MIEFFQGSNFCKSLNLVSFFGIYIFKIRVNNRQNCIDEKNFYEIVRQFSLFFFGSFFERVVIFPKSEVLRFRKSDFNSRMFLAFKILENKLG